jgi:hypothetical protein
MEFFMLSRPTQVPDQDDFVVEVLAAVAHFHITEGPLDVGNTVNLGRPWLPGSRCTHALVSLPYLDGPSLEWGPANSFRCLWLVPITPEELELKKREGLDALEELLERTGVDYAHRLRPSATDLLGRASPSC